MRVSKRRNQGRRARHIETDKHNKEQQEEEEEELLGETADRSTSRNGPAAGEIQHVQPLEFECRLMMGLGGR